jgi:hypothetical protein
MRTIAKGPAGRPKVEAEEPSVRISLVQRILSSWVTYMTILRHLQMMLCLATSINEVPALDFYDVWHSLHLVRAFLNMIDMLQRLRHHYQDVLREARSRKRSWRDLRERQHDDSRYCHGLLIARPTGHICYGLQETSLALPGTPGEPTAPC